MTMNLYLSNTGDQVIKVEIPAANNYAQMVNASNIDSVTLNVGQTYNFKMTKARDVKHVNYTPNSDSSTLEIDRYFQ